MKVQKVFALSIRDGCSRQLMYSPAEIRRFISADTEYAVFVEFGTSKMAAQPYLVPALFIKHASNIVCNRRGDKG